MAGIRHRSDGGTPGPGSSARAVCRLNVRAVKGPNPDERNAEKCLSRMSTAIRSSSGGVSATFAIACWRCASQVSREMLLAGPAAAAPTTNTQIVSVKSGEANLGGFQLQAPVILPDPVPIVLTDLTVSAKATWTGDLTTKLGWDNDKVRQGADLRGGRLASQTSGTLTSSGSSRARSTGSTSDRRRSTRTTYSVIRSSRAEASSARRTRRPATAGLDSLTARVLRRQALHRRQVRRHPEGAVVTRGFAVGGNRSSGRTISRSPTPRRARSSRCRAPRARVTRPVPARSLPLEARHHRDRTGRDQDRRGPRSVWHHRAVRRRQDPVGSAIVSNPSFDLAGSGFLTSMGALLANNIKPTIAPFGTFSGQEGSAVSLSANVSSQCPIDSYVWEFSNGTKSYGPDAAAHVRRQRRLRRAADGTDVTGLRRRRAYGRRLEREASVNAGPDTTADWGRLVQFNGQATDPGSSDRAPCSTPGASATGRRAQPADPA